MFVGWLYLMYMDFIGRCWENELVHVVELWACDGVRERDRLFQQFVLLTVFESQPSINVSHTKHSPFSKTCIKVKNTSKLIRLKNLIPHLFKSEIFAQVRILFFIHSLLVFSKVTCSPPLLPEINVQLRCLWPPIPNFHRAVTTWGHAEVLIREAGVLATYEFIYERLN